MTPCGDHAHLPHLQYKRGLPPPFYRFIHRFSSTLITNFFVVEVYDDKKTSQNRSCAMSSLVKSLVHGEKCTILVKQSPTMRMISELEDRGRPIRIHGDGLPWCISKWQRLKLSKRKMARKFWLATSIITLNEVLYILANLWPPISMSYELHSFWDSKMSNKVIVMTSLKYV